MKTGLTILALAMFIPLVAEGQSPPVAAGTRVRVTAPGEGLDRRVTTIMDVRGDSIVVGDQNGSRIIGLAEVTALEVSTGRKSRLWRGAGMGLGIGVLAGAAIGAVTYEKCDPNPFLSCWMAPGSAMGAAAIGGVLLRGAGLVTGAVIGALIRTDGWAPVDLPVRAAIVPARSGGVSVMLSRSF